MDELFDKSIRTLELPRVLELLANQATSAAAKERARGLTPLTDAEDVERLQEETGAAWACRAVPLFPESKMCRRRCCGQSGAVC